MPYEFEVLQFRITPDLQRFYLVPPRGMLPNPATDDRSTLGAQFIVDDVSGGSLTRNNTNPAKKEDSSSPSPFGDYEPSSRYLCHRRKVWPAEFGFMFSSIVRGLNRRSARVAGHRGGRSMTTISVPGTTARCRRPTPAVSSAGKRVDSAVPERRVGTRTSGAPRAVVSPRRRTRRSLTGARALPPFVDEIPAFLANPSPGLAPAAAANTVVFTGGIKVLLKGLTWPGVINSWFLGTVRGDDAPVASLLSPASPVDRTSDPPRAFPARARNVTMNRDNRYFRLALQPGGVVRRREGRRWSDNEQISDSAANERASPRTRPVHHPSPSFPNPCPTRRNTTTHAY